MVLLFLYYNDLIYYDSRTVPQTKSYSHTSKAAAFLRRARSMYLHCTAAVRESRVHKSIQSKPRLSLVSYQMSAQGSGHKSTAPIRAATRRHSMSKHPENAQFRSPRFTKIRLICLICFPKPLNKLEAVYHAYNIQPVTIIYLNQQQTLAIQCPNTLKMHSVGHQDSQESGESASFASSNH